MAIIPVYIKDLEFNDFLLRADSAAKKAKQSRSAYFLAAVEARMEEDERGRIRAGSVAVIAVDGVRCQPRAVAGGITDSPAPPAAASTAPAAVATGYIRPVAK